MSCEALISAVMGIQDLLHKAKVVAHETNSTKASAAFMKHTGSLKELLLYTGSTRQSNLKGGQDVLLEYSPLHVIGKTFTCISRVLQTAGYAPDLQTVLPSPLSCAVFHMTLSVLTAMPCCSM